MLKLKALTNATIGQWLPKEDFSDLYDEVWNQGNRYFSRPGENNEIDLVIVFQNIEDFSESTESQIMIDFKRHKDRFFLVVWTLTDPENPLGFPIPFLISDPEELKKVHRISKQDKVWIHYLATEDEQIIHIFSEAYQLPESELVIERLQEQLNLSPEEEDDQSQVKEADKLLNEQLIHMGFGYAFDFSAMIKKSDEDTSREKLMVAILQALMMIKNHPLPEVRESNFMVWASEKREGDDSRLLTIYISSSNDELFQFWGASQEENPFTTVLLSFPEFLATLRAQPLQQGGYPIMEYQSGDLVHLQLDEKFRGRLASLWNGEGTNPYLHEE